MSQVNNRILVPFTQIKNTILEDPNLTFQEKGLLSYMINKVTIRSDWEFSANRMANETKEGAASIRKSMNNLINAGYLIQHKLPTGKINYDIVDPNSQTAKEPNNQRGNQATLSNKEDKEIKKDNKKYIKKDLPEREKDFEQLVKDTWQDMGGESFLPILEAQKFFLYWSESNGKKLLYERQKTFDIRKRFKRWQLNNFNQSKPQGRNNA